MAQKVIRPASVNSPGCQTVFLGFLGWFIVYFLVSTVTVYFVDRDLLTTWATAWMWLVCAGIAWWMAFFTITLIVFLSNPNPSGVPED